MNNKKNIQSINKQIELSKRLIGNQVININFYLEKEDLDMTEQANSFGKSLFNGIDIETKVKFYSIGNRYTSFGYGLAISEGKTNEIEHFQEQKYLIEFDTSIKKEEIKEIQIYWMKIPFDDEEGIYPQEIEITTENGYLLISSIEVNNGKVNTEFTDEILVIDNIENAERLKLGRFGIKDNGRILINSCLLYTSPSPRDLSTSRMPSSA